MTPDLETGVSPELRPVAAASPSIPGRSHFVSLACCPLLRSPILCCFFTLAAAAVIVVAAVVVVAAAVVVVVVVVGISTGLLLSQGNAAAQGVAFHVKKWNALSQLSQGSQTHEGDKMRRDGET